MCVQVTYTIMLNQLQVHLPACQDFNTEFSITSNVRSCTLRARYRTLPKALYDFQDHLGRLCYLLKDAEKKVCKLLRKNNLLPQKPGLCS
jgi:hypothetical protein